MQIIDSFCYVVFDEGMPAFVSKHDHLALSKELSSQEFFPGVLKGNGL